MTARKTKAAAASAPASQPDAYDAERYYDVQLARAVEYPAGSGEWLSPANRITMLGRVAEAVRGSVLDAVAV